MSRRAVVIEDGVVVNVILIGDDADPADFDAELVADDTPVGPGWTVVDGKYVAPAPDLEQDSSDGI